MVCIISCFFFFIAKLYYLHDLFYMYCIVKMKYETGWYHPTLNLNLHKAIHIVFFVAYCKIQLVLSRFHQSLLTIYTRQCLNRVFALIKILLYTLCNLYRWAFMFEGGIIVMADIQLSTCLQDLSVLLCVVEQTLSELNMFAAQLEYCFFLSSSSDEECVGG